MFAQVSQAKATPRTVSVKTLSLVGLLAALVVVIGWAVVRESRLEPAVREQAANAWSGEPLRPAFSAQEEAYASGLWPLHEQVKNSAVKMTFAGLAYKMGELDRTGIRARVAPLAEDYVRVAAQVRSLNPPQSLFGLHKQYLEALDLYSNAANEILKVADGGAETHLMAAHEMSERAAVDLLQVGDILWPGEYKPN